MRITMVAFGTRGEVQPYIALGRGLEAAGHSVKIVSVGQLHELVTAYGLTSYSIPFHSFDESQVNENDDVPLRVMFQVAQKFIKESLTIIWEACHDAEAIIFSQLTLAAVTHVLEKLQVPGFMVLVHPLNLRFALYYWREMNACGQPVFELSGLLRHQMEWQLFRPHINRWRKKVLGLPRAPFFGNDKFIKNEKIPLFCAYSSSVFPRCPQWPEHLHVVGYYFLERLPDWQPPQDLVDFLAAGPPPVYVGFSSSIHKAAQKATSLVLDALAKTGQRGILVAGWSKFGKHPQLPDHAFAIESVPHDWLFPQVAAAVHHAGAGTTAACIRAGIPSVTLPFAWDQPFWGQRVADLGIGPPPIAPDQVSMESLAEAINIAVHNEDIRQNAQFLSEQIQKEDGIARTIELFHQYIGA